MQKREAKKGARERQRGRGKEMVYKWNVNDVWKYSQTNIGIMVYSYASVADKKEKSGEQEANVNSNNEYNTRAREEAGETEREDKEMPLMKMVYRDKKEKFIYIYTHTVWLWSVWCVACLFVYRHIVDGLKSVSRCACEYDMNWKSTHKQTNKPRHTYAHAIRLPITKLIEVHTGLQ